MNSNLQIKVGSLIFKNPVLLASGTSGFGKEISKFYPLEILGGFVTKSITLKPKRGNPPPRIWETPCGLLNSIGLENPGLEKFLEEEMPFLEKINTNIFVSIAGESVKEYIELAKNLKDLKISGIELNISCPNVDKGGIYFGLDTDITYELTKSVVKISQKPVWVKLSPETERILILINLLKNAGAEAVVVFNTFLGLAIDWRIRKPIFKRIFAGLSGPSIKPLVLRYIWEIYEKGFLPIVGCGGIMEFGDVMEYILAGASLVEIGTANFINPNIGKEIVLELENYFREEKIQDLIGLAHKRKEDFS
ncbi:MAG: dihydroorotate dehydrogenase [Dictyoglomus sp.]|nr:dihydroorotate dehydrogenase [Dictyoglomus sp.]MCX7942329.1 dihydroorotate dehydrogenase [Dictyoglomaceae bacterium]MDW8188638.1 dihydroorotate dehydrogenase [Dictyoglomus sp.]